MHVRIKKIRQSFKLTQEEFGSRLGVSRDVINNLERGRVSLKDHIIKLICVEFNVNEEWLRTGEGEMFKAVSKEDEYFKAATELSIHGDDMAMQAVIEYWKLDEDSKKLLKDFMFL